MDIGQVCRTDDRNNRFTAFGVSFAHSPYLEYLCNDTVLECIAYNQKFDSDTYIGPIQTKIKLVITSIGPLPYYRCASSSFLVQIWHSSSTAYALQIWNSCSLFRIRSVALALPQRDLYSGLFLLRHWSVTFFVNRYPKWTVCSISNSKTDIKGNDAIGPEREFQSDRSYRPNIRLFWWMMNGVYFKNIIFTDLPYFPKQSYSISFVGVWVDSDAISLKRFIVRWWLGIGQSIVRIIHVVSGKCRSQSWGL